LSELNYRTTEMFELMELWLKVLPEFILLISDEQPFVDLVRLMVETRIARKRKIRRRNKIVVVVVM